MKDFENWQSLMVASFVAGIVANFPVFYLLYFHRCSGMFCGVGTLVGWVFFGVPAVLIVAILLYTIKMRTKLSKRHIVVHAMVIACACYSFLFYWVIKHRVESFYYQYATNNIEISVGNLVIDSEQLGSRNYRVLYLDVGLDNSNYFMFEGSLASRVVKKPEVFYAYGRPYSLKLVPGEHDLKYRIRLNENDLPVIKQKFSEEQLDEFIMISLDLTAEDGTSIKKIYTTDVTYRQLFDTSNL